VGGILKRQPRAVPDAIDAAVPDVHVERKKGLDGIGVSRRCDDDVSLRMAARAKGDRAAVFEHARSGDVEMDVESRAKFGRLSASNAQIRWRPQTSIETWQDWHLNRYTTVASEGKFPPMGVAGTVNSGA